MIWLKACHKCSGDMHYDLLTEEYVCLQCGQAVDRIEAPGSEPAPKVPAASLAATEAVRNEKKR